MQVVDPTMSVEVSNLFGALHHGRSAASKSRLSLTRSLAWLSLDSRSRRVA